MRPVSLNCHKCFSLIKLDNISISELTLQLFDTDKVLEARKEAMSNMSRTEYKQTIGKLFGAEIKCTLVFDFKGD